MFADNNKHKITNISAAKERGLFANVCAKLSEKIGDFVMRSILRVVNKTKATTYFSLNNYGLLNKKEKIYFPLSFQSFLLLSALLDFIQPICLPER